MPGKKKKKDDEARKEAIEKQIVDLVMRAYKDFCVQRSGLITKWRNDDKQYHNLMELRNYKGISRIKVPATYDAVTTLLAFALEVFFVKDMPVKMKGYGKEDVEKAELYNKFLKLKMSNMNFRERVRQALLCWFKYGTCIIKDAYNADLMGADFVPIMPQDAYFNVLAKNHAALDIFIHKIRRSEYNILDNKKQYDWSGRLKTRLKNVNEEALKECDRFGQDIYPHLLAEMGISKTEYTSHIKYHDIYEAQFRYDLEGDGKYVWCVATISDGQVLLRYKKSMYEEITAEICSLEDIEGMMIGRSVPSRIKDQAIELNDIRSQMMDSGIAGLKPMFVLDEFAQINTTDLVFKQGGVIRSKGGQGGLGGLGVQPLVKTYDMNAGLLLEKVIRSDIQALSGATPSLVDVFAAGKTTAFESRRALSASTRRVIDMLRKFEDNVLKPWMKKDFEYTKKYVPWSKMLRVMGHDAAKFGQANLTKFFDIQLDAIAIGVEEIEDKMLKMQHSMNLLNLATKLPGVANIHECFIEVVTRLGYDNPDKFVFPLPKQTREAPEDENIMMSNGEKVRVNVRDYHQNHIMVHNDATVKSPEMLELISEHVNQHHTAMRMLAQSQAAAPPQEQQKALPAGPAHGVPESEARRRVEQPPTTV